MNIIVCVKQITDPEVPPTSIKIDAPARRIIPAEGIAAVLSPFDLHAIEAALRIKETSGAKVTILSMGSNLLREVVKKPLAMGADELILLEDSAFADGDSISNAYTLATAVRKIGAYDLILCGRQAADWDFGQTGIGMAEMLGIPCITIARKVAVVDGKAVVERVVADGYEVIETPLPALITVSNELGEPRYPTIKGILASKKIEPVVWKPAEISIDPAKTGAMGRNLLLVNLFQPVRESRCEIIGGETPEEAGANLAVKLREAKLL